MFFTNNRLVLKLFRVLGHQKWLKFGIRDRIIRFFFSPENKNQNKFDVPFFDLTYIGEYNNFIDWNVFFYGAYELGDLLLLRKIIQKLKIKKNYLVTFDIGANVGNHSLFFAKYCDEVHSFEPLPELTKKISEKIKINSLVNVFIHQIALGVQNESKTFYAPVGNNLGTGSFIKEINSDSNIRQIEIDINNGDEYIKSAKIKSVDIIKIDVEGFECNVIKGLRETILKYKPVIFIEYNSFTHEYFSNNMVNGLLSDEYFFTEIEIKKKKLHFKEFNYNGNNNSVFILTNDHIATLSI